MKQTNWLLVLCLFVGLSCQASASPDDEGEAAWPFFAFCMDTHDTKKRTLPQQAEMLKELGYAGCGHLWPNKADTRAETLSNAKLRLFQVYVRVNLAKPKPFDKKAVAEILPALKPHKTQLTLLITGGKRSDNQLDDKAVVVVKRIADMTKDYNVKIALYPHTGDWLETSGDAVRIAKKVNRPGEVGTMFNLCHWMKADPNRNLRAVLKEAQPWLMAVSLSGSDTPKEVRSGKGNWIQPLGHGSYDISAFLNALQAINYSGPVGLQCWGIRSDAGKHLKQSIETWNVLRANSKSSNTH